MTHSICIGTENNILVASVRSNTRGAQIKFTEAERIEILAHSHILDADMFRIYL